MKYFKSILKTLALLKTSSQLEYYIRTKQPQTHAELEILVRDFYSCRGL